MHLIKFGMISNGEGVCVQSCHSEGPGQAGEMSQRTSPEGHEMPSPGGNNPMHQDKLGANWLENSFAEKHLCFLMVANMNEPATCPDHISKECYVHFWAPAHKA